MVMRQSAHTTCSKEVDTDVLQRRCTATGESFRQALDSLVKLLKELKDVWRRRTKGPK